MRQKALRKINSLIVISCLSLFFACLRLSYAGENQKKQNLDITASATVDKSVIAIGDKITYSVIVKAKSGIEVELAKILPENLTEFSVKDFGSSQKGFFDRKTFTWWYLLDTFVTGQHTIPAVSVKYRPKGSLDWKELPVNEVKVNVKSVLDTTKNLTDIRGILGRKSKVSPYVILAVALIILISGAVFSIIHFKNKKKDSITPPAAHIIAYEALAALEKKDYILNGQLKAYYIELSNIVRSYLENRFAIRAPEMTTEEFLIKVKEDSALSLDHKGLLRDFLLNCDLVKFAKYQPARQEAELSLDSAKRLIDQTRSVTVQHSKGAVSLRGAKATKQSF